MTQAELNNHIAYIQVLHKNLANDYCNTMKFYSRGLAALEKKNLLLAQYIETLYRQNLTDTSNNTLDEKQVKDILNDCYRQTIDWR